MGALTGSRASHEADKSSSPKASIPSAPHWGDGVTPCHVEFDYADQQDANEREDEADLYCEAEQNEIRCALALFRSLKRDFGEYLAVKVDGPLNWTITKPRTPEALLAALDTAEPPTALAAAQPLIARLNAWETFWTNRYRWAPSDAKRIEVRVGDLRELRAASAIEARRAATGNTDAVEDESAPGRPEPSTHQDRDNVK